MTDRQKRFCEEYLTELNATQAAIRAGYSEKYAHTNANKLLQNTTIQKYIADLQADLREKTKITQKQLISELTTIGFADVDTQNIKAADKIKALIAIAEMLGLDKPKEDDDGGLVRELLEEYGKV
ncbi:MAG: terminase small subunit [Clostridia bacterium]|nr:terminase small subunit [Clostridia bacterium]